MAGRNPWQVVTPCFMPTRISIQAEQAIQCRHCLIATVGDSSKFEKVKTSARVAYYEAPHFWRKGECLDFSVGDK
jgi:hypothetical protein